jgi:hypothetical protein
LIFDHHDEAERLLRDLLASDPSTPMPHAGLADTLGRKGQLVEAVVESEQWKTETVTCSISSPYLESRGFMTTPASAGY